MPEDSSRLKLLAVVEATTINAVARNVLDFHRFAQRLRRRDPDFPTVEVGIATFVRTPSGAFTEQPENEFVISARAAGLTVDIMPERRRFDRRVIAALGRIVADRKPDLVVTHSVKSHFIVLRSRVWRRYPWLAFHHGYTATDRKMHLYNQFDRWSLKKADRVITVCEAFAKELTESKGVAGDRITVQHNSIGPAPPTSRETLDQLRAQLEIKDDKRIILTAGRLSNEKAQIDLLSAVKVLCESNPGLSVKVIIAGEGPERGNLENAAKALGIGDRINFAGHVDDVQPYYRLAEVLANSSHSEGSPYVLLEAMAAGLPIVATAVGGVPEMLSNDETALLVEPQNAAAMADALMRVLNEEGLAQRLSESASALVASRFSPEAYVRSLVQTYREVIQGRLGVDAEVAPA